MRATRRPAVICATVLIAVASVALASCGDDDDDGSAESAEDTSPGTDATTSATGTTASTEPTVPPTGSTVPTEETSPPSSTPDDQSHAACAYRRDLVLVRFPDAEHDPVSINDVLSDPLSGEVLAGQIGAVGEDAGVRLEQLFAAEFIDAYNVAAGLDPLQVATAIESEFEETEASPVLLTTITGHWTYAPGDNPIQNVNDPGTAPEGAPDPQTLVAVVDTGYSDSLMPLWLQGRADALDAVDAEPTNPALNASVHGHGAFVASLIAQEAPLADIRVARVANVGSDDVWTEGEPGLATMIDSGHASDELQLYVAVARLLGDEPPPYDALNVSLGSYTCGEALVVAPDDADETALLDSGFAILAAMKRWDASTDGAPVFAAAGNHAVGETPPSPFIPAAYGPFVDPNVPAVDPNVFAIASVEADGTTESNFSNPSTITAFGRDLIGIRDDGAWWGWSGTSFATAVATATYLNDNPVDAASSPLMPNVIQPVT